ncbi:MAG: metal ABC transporter substrate-binding protein [Fidelibacterota bacterium]
MKKYYILLLLSSFLLARIRVVTSTTDLADIVKTIGGNRVTVASIARGNQDPHYVEVLPSYMLKMKKADLYFKVGMELDLWSQQIIDGSRNRKLKIIDCSTGIEKLEVPTSRVNASMGDIHRFGNPHYWLDPENGKRIAVQVVTALTNMDPEGGDLYRQNYESFSATIDSAVTRWEQTYSDLKGKRIIFYHNSWPYFAQRFGLVTREFLEPKPGITPSPAHLNDLVQLVKAEGIRIVGSESYFSTKAPEFLAKKTGIIPVQLAQSVGALEGVNSYLDIFEFNLKTLAEAYGVNHD